METFLYFLIPFIVASLKNFLKGMETQLIFLYKRNILSLKNFLKGMETERASGAF